MTGLARAATLARVARARAEADRLAAEAAAGWRRAGMLARTGARASRVDRVRAEAVDRGRRAAARRAYAGTLAERVAR